MGLINDEGYPYLGKLDFIDNRVDPNTGTIRVRGVFANPKPERGSRPLAPGLFARVRVPLGAPHEALLVTERAVSRNQGKTFVFVVDGEGKVEKRDVTLGANHGNLRVVVAGLQSGERIVINGLQRVRHGAKVVAIEKPMVETSEP
jgi:RND family efflux transporter MFP subunit